MNPWLIATPIALTAAAVTAYGGVNPRSELFGPTVWRTNSPRKLAITFDDGPNPKITPELLKVLERHEARVTFFGGAIRAGMPGTGSRNYCAGTRNREPYRHACESFLVHAGADQRADAAM